MQKHSRHLKIGLLVFVVGVVLLFPARVAYRWFAPAEFVASGISGSVWSGTALEATADGLYFRNLNWRFRPLYLLTAKLGYAIESELASGSFKGNVAVGTSGTLVARDLDVTLPLDAMQSIPGLAGLRGNASANFIDLRIESGLPVVADGTVEVTGLLIPLLHVEPLGGFKAEFFSQESGISASIEDTNAVIEVAGSLQISSTGSYQLIAQLSATAETPAPVRQQLQFLGSANARGQHEFRLEGQL